MAEKAVSHLGNYSRKNRVFIFICMLRAITTVLFMMVSFAEVYIESDNDATKFQTDFGKSSFSSVVFVPEDIMAFWTDTPRSQARTKRTAPPNTLS